jgi:uncharacterized protein YjiS (DUF1127 family)
MTIMDANAFVALWPMIQALGSWLERIRQRRELLRLPEAMLKDIGISQCDAWCEAQKPFWKA